MKVIALHRVWRYSWIITICFLVDFIITACDKEDYALEYTSKPLSFITLSKNIKNTTRAPYSGEFGTTIYHAKTLDELTNWNPQPADKEQKIYDQIDNAKVTFNNNVWSIETEKYWPTEGGLLVVAYSPHSTDINRPSMPHNMHSSYIYGTTRNNQTDLLFADVRWLPVDKSSDSAIPITFNHALAMLSVNIRVASLSVGDNSWRMTLKKVELCQVSNIGQVIITNNGNNVWTTNNGGAWNVDADVYETNINFTRQVEMTSTYLKVFENKIVIPQILLQDTNSKKQYLKITYDLETTRTYRDEDGVLQTKVEVDKNQVKEIPFRTAQIDIWKMGQHYTYNVTFNFSKPIEFEGSAQPWGDEINVNPF